MTTKTVGNKGEDMACVFLEIKGFQILKRNFLIRGGEIDIIAMDQDVMVFIEVKTRYSSEYGLAIEAITPWKVKFLLKTARVYLQKINWGDKPYRLDAVTIDFNEGDDPKIELITNITQ